MKKGHVIKEVVKERKGYVEGNDESNNEMLNELFDGKPFISKLGAKLIGKKRKVMIGELDGIEKLKKIAEKNNARGGVCKVLVEKGEISRENYKKFNRWGDIRWLKEFTDEEMREGIVYYVVKTHLR